MELQKILAELKSISYARLIKENFYLPDICGRKFKKQISWFAKKTLLFFLHQPATFISLIIFDDGGEAGRWPERVSRKKVRTTFLLFSSTFFENSGMTWSKRREQQQQQKQKTLPSVAFLKVKSLQRRCCGFNGSDREKAVRIFFSIIAFGE